VKTVCLFCTLDLERSFECASDALGSSIPVVIGGVAGILEMPKLPVWGDAPSDPLHMPLIAPKFAETWRQGDSLVNWGKPSTYPNGDARVSKLLIHFQVPSENLRETATAIYSGIDRWGSFLFDYFRLVTKQYRAMSFKILDQSHDADIFIWDPDGKKERPYDKSPSHIDVRIADRISLLNRERLAKICALASADKPIALEYRVQLEAYNALYQGDFRKAIVETAVAAELALTNGLRRHFEIEKVCYGDKLFKKFRMLGGRLELARIVGLELPNKDLDNDLIEPRNSVIHKALFVDEGVAIRAVDATDEILQLLCQSFAEET
jgi:hypothetical protein